jgi:hypothetical protein
MTPVSLAVIRIKEARSRRKVMLNWRPETTNLLTTVIMMEAMQ